MRKCRLLSLVGLTLLIALSPAFGRTRHKKATPAPRHETVISSVTPTEITITEDKTPRTFTITQFTEVTLDGQRASVADLKPGMAVSVTLSDPSHLSRITAVNKK
jgi:hypothetical protein